MRFKPSILFLSVLPPDYSPLLASSYGMERSFDLMPHKIAVLALVAWLREHGCEGHYVWAQPASEDPIEVFRAAIQKFKPDALGLSLTTEEFMQHYRIMQKIKAEFPQIPIITGGPHVTGLPEHTLMNFPEYDFVVIGEGERTLEELLKSIASGDRGKLAEIDGIAYRDEAGKILRTPPRENIPDINILPDPAYDLIFNPENPPDETSAFPLVCSYGCYFFCTFCSVPHGYYRGLDPVRVADRIERAQKSFGIEYFAIRDSFWPPTREWLDKFCDEIEKRNLKIKFHFQTRAGTLTEEQMVRLRQIGAQAIAIGVEAGDPKILKSIRKGITINMVRRTVAGLNKAGIFSITFFMFGNVGETRATMRKSIDLAREVNPSIAFFLVLYPLPGAEAFESVPDDQRDWWMTFSPKDGIDNLPSVCDLTVPELRALATDTFIRYPLRWAYLRQHVIGGKLSPEFRRIARQAFLIHLRKYILGKTEGFAPARIFIRGVKRMLGK